jgi:SNF family Na+-dependent transporter
MTGMFTLFLILLYVAGIDSAYSYVESLVCNILDHFRVNTTQHLGQRIGVTAFVCIMGIALSAIFTTNFGWILFDLVDHYMSSYIVIAVGLM